MSVFTEIIAGNIPGNFVWKDETCVAFATIEPHTDGHVLVVPREEIDKFTDVDPDLAAHLFQVAQIIGQAQEATFDCDRAGLVIAGYGVPHCHLHVIPMTSEKDLSFDSKTASPDDVPEAMDKLRATLAQMGHAEFVEV